MTVTNHTIGELRQFGSNLAELVSRLVAAGTPCPLWDTKQVAWRHETEDRNAILFLMLKLSGAVSAVNAMIVLGERGFSFEAAILARAVSDADLCIAFMLPTLEEISQQWPSVKQKEMLDEFFKETWNDPAHPYEDSRQRPHIVIKDLKEGLARFQGKNTEMNPHDTGQTALQMMRYLSDYTHMAYPRMMELRHDGGGYRLNGEQQCSSAFNVAGIADTLRHCAFMADCVALYVTQMFRSIAKLAEIQGNSEVACKLEKKVSSFAPIQIALESLHARIEKATMSGSGNGIPSSQKLLRDFKGK